MELREAFAKKKKQIVDIWVERTLDSYPSSAFFKRSKDRFANPVGTNIREGLTRIFELLAAGAPADDYVDPLDQVVRIRAVQEFVPSQAVAPILELKWVVKQVLGMDKETRPLLMQLDQFDCAVDRVALGAFDIYCRCREQLYRNRVREIKSGRYILADSACSASLVRQQVQAKEQVQ